MRITRNKLIISLSCAWMAISLLTPVKAEQSFRDWEMKQFKDSMEEDYMNLHFSVKNPAKYGIQVKDISLGKAPSRKEYEKGLEENKKSLEELKQFDRSKLSEQEKVDYDVLKDYLEESGSQNFYDFQFHFLPQSGLVTNLTTNFTEFKIKNEEDIKNYLKVLESVPSYVDGALTMTKDQAGRGFFMSDKALDETISQINKFVRKKKDSALILTFHEKVRAIKGLSSAKKAEYEKKNRELVLQSYIPCYEKIRKELGALRGSRKGKTLYDMKGGLTYYSHLLRQKSNSKGSPKEIFGVVDKALDKEVQSLVSVAMSSKESEVEEKLPPKDPTAILEGHKKNLEKLFPTPAKVQYKASYLDPSVANDGVVAYYLNPMIDDIQNNVIRINKKAVSNTNEMYSTLAHEGYPGHLYQMTWYLNTNPHPIRSVVSHIGYSEGWAMYVEDAMWQFSGMNKKAVEYNRSLTNINYMLSAAIDIGVNGLGWKQEDVVSYVNSKGLSGDVAKNLYDVVVRDPAAYVPYGVGLAQFLTMKYKVVEKLGVGSLKELHEVFLKNGDRPFWMVEKDVEDFLIKKGVQKEISFKNFIRDLIQGFQELILNG
ncbi:DUF885 family protein [Bulleidia sp. zg-1006]|uniref:DUF885 family protein n=1 Tax=Bulleidia sp. zg-1006 TaxID=2806552 RepID=UPI001939C8CD|nr:DUF885 family protein [Bulleidia sp. zg-1006]QRG86896.1 DUF885 domain-containing protein [Bulleidia sp. zg-1006]